MADEIIYPVTKETMHTYAKSIFDPILKGECVTAVWVPMAGRRKLNKFIIENIQEFEKELPHYDKYILSYVEPLDLTEESLVGYLRIIGESFIETCRKNPHTKNNIPENIETLFNSQTSSYSELLDALRNLLLEITNTGLEVVLFLGEFDELSFGTKIFYKNLKSLWTRLYPRLHYVFLVTKVVDIQDYYSFWDELSEPILQNVLYIPLPYGKDFDYLLKRFSAEFETQISDEYIAVVQETCGGHPYSMKAAIRLLRDHAFTTPIQFEETLLENYELQSVASGIYDRRSPEEQDVLLKIIQDKELDESEKKVTKFLIQLGLVIDENENYRPFSRLFLHTIEKRMKRDDNTQFPRSLTFDPQTGAVLYSGKTVEEQFTRQEYSILTLFLQNPGKLLSRDDIGSVLWGDSSYEKYSDWAIDQLMSKLRKKLKQIGSNIDIATLRGRGYKFIQNV